MSLEEGTLTLSIWQRYTKYRNHHFVENEWWHSLEDWFVFFHFKPKETGWFGSSYLRYDQYQAWTRTFLGLTFGRGYTFEADYFAEPKGAE